MSNPIFRLKPDHISVVGEGKKARKVSTVGFRTPIAYAHLMDHLGTENPEDRWCDTECFARSIFGKNTQMNREESRSRMSYLFRALLPANVFLLLDYSDPHRAIASAKILDPESEADRVAARIQIDRLVSKNKLYGELLERARRLSGA